MLRRKRSKWFEIIISAQSPIRFDEFSSTNERDNLISFLIKKIKSKELEGYISDDQQRFIPKSYIVERILQFFDKTGVVDICDLIDLTGLAGDVIEPIISDNMQKFDGFFDLLNRKFYSKTGAITTINQIIRKSSTYDLKYLLNQLYWSENQLEAVLDLMADSDLFNGYIDPSRYRLYNFKNIDFTLDSMKLESIKALTRFIQTSFRLSKEVSLIDLSRLTKLSEKDLQQFLKRYKRNWSFIFSNNHDFIFPTIEIFMQILLDIYVYKNIPLEFWISRLDVDFNDFYEFLTVLNSELKGTLTKDELIGSSIMNWYKKGIDVEKLASRLNLNVLNLLKQIKYLGNLLNLNLVAGETFNPFLVKGNRIFEIFCQIDTSSHTNPSIYFECQNCRRIMCSNCRNIESTHECPFCGNISAFIVDLPRYCSECQITYTHSFNLETAEECYFCKKGPLKSGWFPPSISTTTFTQLELKLESHIKNFYSSSLDLKQIINHFTLPSKEIIGMLEKLILHHKIKGNIDIKKMRIQLITDQPKTDCKVCGIQKTNREMYICNSCKSDVCISCYSGMEVVGMTACPECGNKLELKNN